MRVTLGKEGAVLIEASNEELSAEGIGSDTEFTHFIYVGVEAFRELMKQGQRELEARDVIVGKRLEIMTREKAK